MTSQHPHASQSLEVIETAIWHALSQAATDRGHEWRRCVVATTGPEGPEARTMVLRECDPEQALLVLYTDARSPKLTQIATDPRVQLVFWSGALKWQLRVRARAHAETEGLAVSARWARMRFSPAAQDYLSHLPPGSPLHPTSQAHAQAIEHHQFALFKVHVLDFDWLELHAEGHRRARFDGEGGRAWLAP